MPDSHSQREPSPEEQFALLVKETREAQGWSQEELARLVSDHTGVTIHQTGIARIEGGRRNIRYNEVVALSEVLGIYVSGAHMQPRVDRQAEQTIVAALEQAKRQLAEADNTAYRLQVEMETLTARYARARNQMVEANETVERLQQALAEHRTRAESRNGE